MSENVYLVNILRFTIPAHDRCATTHFLEICCLDFGVAPLHLGRIPFLHNSFLMQCSLLVPPFRVNCFLVRMQKPRFNLSRKLPKFTPEALNRSTLVFCLEVGVAWAHRTPNIDIYSRSVHRYSSTQNPSFTEQADLFSSLRSDFSRLTL